MLDWKQINGDWYCYQNGILVKGWIQDTDKRWYYLNTADGKMATGWIQVDSRWYYLYPQRTEKDGVIHYIGEMATGWIQIDSRWYYLYPTKTVNYGITYPMGAMAVDWVQLNYKWYYLLKENTEYNGNTHYTGEMVASTTMTINNKSYTFDASGAMQGSDSLVSDNLVKFVAGWEAFYSYAYKDPYYPGVQAKWTIGYGTTYEANSSAFPNGLSSTCTEGQAKEWLKQEINKVAVEIKSALDAQGATLSQNAFDCLCDIGYNAGVYALLNGSRTTFNAVISGNANSITTALMSWNKANGQVSEGLTKRCTARVNMCLYAIYNSTH